MPATYLYTLDTYTSDEFTRVAEMLAFGVRVYGLMTALPPNVHLIQHEHHPQDLTLHERFYSTWNIPNGGKERTNSCCNKQDCYPTAIRLVGGTYWAQRREDGKWLPIPDGKLEQHQPGSTGKSRPSKSCVHVAAPRGGSRVLRNVGGGDMTIQAEPYLRQTPLDPRGSMRCPDCGETFIAAEGVYYPVHYIKNGSVGYGVLGFCNTKCLLDFVCEEDGGKA